MRLTRRTVMLGGATLPLLVRRASAQQSAGIFRFGLQGYPASLAPWVHPGTSATTARLMIHRGLLGYDADGKLRGELAESWEHDGGTGWTFHLRDAVFHNGAPVTSEDIKWSLEQVMAPDSTAYLRGTIQQIARVEAPDPKTVKVITKQPVVTVPLWMASCFLPMVAKNSTAGGAIGIGAGPFLLTEQARGESLTFAAFDKFYRPGLPKIQHAKFIAYPDDTLRVSALQAGDVDAIEFVPWPLMKDLNSNPKVKLDNSDDGIFMFLVFNGTVKPFDNPLVRLAIAHAIRREEIVKAVFYDEGATLESLPVTKTSLIYDEASKNAWAYDPAKAKALLAQAGLADGFSCKILVASTFAMHRDTGQVVQQHLAEIGIQAELVQQDWPTRVTSGDRGQYEMAVCGMALDNNDPDGLSEVLSSQLNPSNLRSYKLVVPGMDEALAAGRTEFDPEKRKAIYAKVRELALANAPLVTLTWRRQSYGVGANVRGFHNMPGALTGYSGTTIEQTLFA